MRMPVEHRRRCAIALPCAERPRRDVVQLAKGIRDRLFRPVREAKEAARQRARAEEAALIASRRG
jgi:hypothetical protein